MSLFKWSTPERRKADQMLPVIPNEIYISIFECIASPTTRLESEELEIFTKLSHVCRFFANFCLPRIFEFVEFSGSVFGDDTPTGLCNDAPYKTSPGAMLCTQITAKQPLALALAKRVRVCHFTNWQLGTTGAWAVKLFAKKFISALSHMKNIRELRFSVSFVDADAWSAIADLDSLEELSFDLCQFIEGPADVEPERRVKVKVACLRVTGCIGHRHPIAAVDPQHLRTLAMDFMFFNQIDWLSQSSLTELHFSWRPFYPTQHWYLMQLHTMLMQAPHSIEALCLAVDARTELSQDMIRKIFDGPAWENLPLLRSLTLRVRSRDSEKPAETISFLLDSIAPLVDLQSFTLIDCVSAPDISLAEVQHVLCDKLGRSCRLSYADIYGKALRLVNGEWTEASYNSFVSAIVRDPPTDNSGLRGRTFSNFLGQPLGRISDVHFLGTNTNFRPRMIITSTATATVWDLIDDLPPAKSGCRRNAHSPRSRYHRLDVASDVSRVLPPSDA